MSSTSKSVAIVHPAIERESTLIDRSVEMAEAAFENVSTGAAEPRIANVMLGASRVMQSAARTRLQSRLAAGKLAMQEAKLVSLTA